MILDFISSRLPSLISPTTEEAITGATIAGTVFGFFAWVEGLIKKDTKDLVAQWLQNVKETNPIQHWSDTFTTIFDRVFGENHFSPECFCKSCLMTMLIGSISIFIIEVINFNKASLSDLGYLVPMVVLITISNCIPDYLSLLKSRILLRYMSRLSFLFTLPLLLCDAILCIICGALSLILFTTIIYIILLPGHKSPTVAPVVYEGEMLRHVMITYLNDIGIPLQDDDLERSDQRNIGIMVLIPACLTLFWSIAYIVTGFLIKAVLSIKVTYSWIVRYFNIDEKPLQIMGAISGIICGMVYVTSGMIAELVYSLLRYS